MKLTSILIPSITGLALIAACDPKGSVGEYPESESSSDSEGGGESSDTGGESQSTTDPTASTSASTGMTSASTSNPTASTTDPTDSDTAGGDCGPNFCTEFQIDCTQVQCGGLSMFDENGCLRQNCTGSPDVCGDGERCYFAIDFGGCASSGIDCSDNFDQMECICGGDADCNGGYCVPEEDYPTASPGPEGPARAEDSCAPNDGPAFTYSFGLSEQTCVSGAGAGDVVRITIYQNPPTPGTYQVGQGSQVGHAQVETGGEFVPALSGTITIDSYDETTGTVGSYDVVFPEEDGGHLGADFDIEVCRADVLCG